MRQAKSVLNFWQEDPQRLLTATTNIFGKDLPEDEILKTLRTTEPETDRHLLDALKCILSALQKVFDNQLSKETAADEDSEEMLTATKSARPNTISVERCLGMVQALWSRAPTASMSFIDAKVKAKMNGTVAWLDCKSEKDQDYHVSFARKWGAIDRKIRQKEESLVDVEINNRIFQCSKKRDVKKKNEVERNVRKALSQNDPHHDVFESISEDQKHFFMKLFTKGDLQGSIFCHILEENGKDEFNWGRINQVGEYVKGSYWTDGNSEEDYVEHTFKLSTILTDMVIGDFHFVQL